MVPNLLNFVSEPVLPSPLPPSCMRPSAKSLQSALFVAIILVTSLGAVEKAPGTIGGATPLEWSTRMANSEIARQQGKLAYKPAGKAHWDYAAGLFTLSLIKLSAKVDAPKYITFANTSVGSFVDESGQIVGLKFDDFSLDNLNSGKTALALYSHTGDERFRKAADLLRSQLDRHPRTSGGGFWHKKRYPHQMWLDGLYMGTPFYAEYALRFDQPASFNDIVKQFQIVDAAAYDAKTGLYYHGWDESKQQEWANSTTGTSPNFWSRGLGWYGMALVDVLDFLPLDHPGRPELIAQLNKFAQGIVRYQDGTSGLWYQVTNQGARKGNYLEATGSSMLVYTLAKAVNRGYLGANYSTPAQKGYEGLVRDLVTSDPDGKINLIRCCQVAGLGNGRDGSYEYYLREPIVNNDLKGIGPFILAGIEMDLLLNPPSWNDVPRILQQISEPTFPNRDFSIVTFGAVADGKSDCTDAIRQAIEACHAAGGGRVVVPAGDWLTGAIHLKSNVNLHVSEGAKLLFSTDPRHYLPAVPTRFEGMDCVNYSPFIYAFAQENIAVTGKGTLDGQADFSNWWGWVKIDQKQRADPKFQRASREKLYSEMDGGIPTAKRQYGEGHYLRPNFIQTFRCRTVLIEDVTILRSPMWEIHPLLCTNVTVRGVNILSHGPNNDGCDPESCRNVLIDHCTFDTGDDCIAIKSGRNNDGRRWLVPAENIVIRGCTMKDGHGGTVIGSEISGSCRNVFTEHCEMDSPNLDRVLRLKTNAVRGGILENIFMRDVTVGRVADAILTIDFNYEEGENGHHYPLVQNVVMENITAKSTPRVLSLLGYAKSPIRNVRVINSTFGDIQGTDEIKYVEGLDLKNVKIEKR